MTIRVLCVGDSNTHGIGNGINPDPGNVLGGYREQLDLIANADGTRLHFVGSLQDGPSTMTSRRHDGHDGFSPDGIAQNLTEWITYPGGGGGTVDVVVLMAGTNGLVGLTDTSPPDGLFGVTYTSQGDDVAACIDLVEATTAYCLVLPIPPLVWGNPGTVQANYAAYIDTFNTYLKGIVDSRHAANRRVKWVPVPYASTVFPGGGQSGTNIHLSTAQSDGVHLSTLGMQVVAQAVYDALITLNYLPGLDFDEPAEETVTLLGSSVQRAGGRAVLARKGGPARVTVS
jgi:lysophospholipase L1-like esterase